MTGDFDYVMKVESLVGNSGDGGWAKVELMARLEDPSSPGIGPQGNDPHISNMTTRPSSDTAAGGPAGVNYRGPPWRAHREIIGSESVVTVTQDTTPPTIVEVKPLSSQTSLQVTFSEPVTPSTPRCIAQALPRAKTQTLPRIKGASGA